MRRGHDRGVLSLGCGFGLALMLAAGSVFGQDLSALRSITVDRALARAEEALSGDDQGALIDAFTQAIAEPDALVPALSPGERDRTDGRNRPPEPVRWITASDRVAILVAQLGPAGRRQWRTRIDALARRRWDEAASATSSSDRIERLAWIVDQAISSSVGRLAALHLGDLYLERGWFAAARSCYERLHPGLVVPPERPDWWTARPGQSLATAIRAFGARIDASPTRPPEGSDAEPNSDSRRRLDRSEAWVLETEQRAALATSLLGASPPPDRPICLEATPEDWATGMARLALVSILEGRADRAEIERDILAAVAPDATGSLGGQTGRWLDLIDSRWPATETTIGTATNAPPIRPSWLPRRSDLGQASTEWPLGESLSSRPIWEVPVAETPQANRPAIVRWSLNDPYRPSRPTAFWPQTIVNGSMVAWTDPSGVRAVQLATGRPYWGLDEADPSDAEDPRSAIAPLREGRPTPTGLVYDSRSMLDGFSASLRVAGRPRLPLTAWNDRLLASVGSPVTWFRTRGENIRLPGAAIVLLDGNREGALVSRPQFPEGPLVRYEGAPMTDGERLYSLRRAGVSDEIRSTLSVVAVDLIRGRLLWERTLVVETMPEGVAGVVGTGQMRLDQGRLTVMTGAGLIVSLDAATGRPAWAIAYPREGEAVGAGDRSLANAVGGRDERPILRRDGSVLIAGGRILAAPADTDRVLAVEQMTGRPLWWDRPPADGLVDRLLDVVPMADPDPTKSRDRPGRTGSDGTAAASSTPSEVFPSPGRDVLIATGERVVWFDADTGQPLTAWPRPDFPPASIVGRGLVTPESIIVPTATRLIVLERVPVWAGGYVPVPRRDLALTSVGLEGGDLAAGRTETGRQVVVLTTPDRIVGLDAGLSPVTDASKIGGPPAP